MNASDTDTQTSLDGFSIAGGNATASYPANSGGGLYNDSGSLTVADCTFTANYATEFGGAIYSNTSNAVLVSCVFRRNSAGSAGGAMGTFYSNLTLVACLFIKNWTDDGGAVYAGSDGSTFVDCVFRGNATTYNGYGGGLGSSTANSPVWINCLFENNLAGSGGGGAICLANNCSPLLIDCVFTGNSAGYLFGTYSGTGGAMCNYGTNSFPSLINCIFSGNRARQNAGGIYNAHCTPSFVSCLFVGNRARDTAGGVYNIYNSPILTNCTFVGNSTDIYGGGLLNIDSTVAITNCIFWGNVDGGGLDESAQIHGGMLDIDYSCLQGLTGAFGGVGNISEVPVFLGGPFGTWTVGATYNEDTSVTTFTDGAAQWETDILAGKLLNPDTSQFLQGLIVGNEANIIVVQGDFASYGTVGTAYQVNDYHLGMSSPCIDAGDNTSVPLDEADLDNDGNTSERVPVDLDGNPRFQDDLDTVDTGVPDPPLYVPVVDMGAYEAEGIIDCNFNGVPDDEDIAGGTSTDCDGNGIPDECDGAEAPWITLHPISQALCEGDTAGFTVVAEGTPSPAYQWRRDSVDIPGATEPSYVIDPATAAESGIYDVVVTNVCGTATSDPATLTVVTAADCNDDNTCTDDSCAGGVCGYAFNSEPCNDGDPCTVNDECIGGSCEGIYVPRLYGDVYPVPEGDGAVEIYDTLCILDAAGGVIDTLGCMTILPTGFQAGDIWPCLPPDGPGPDGAVEIMDVLAVLDAAAGNPQCSAPCP